MAIVCFSNEKKLFTEKFEFLAKRTTLWPHKYSFFKSEKIGMVPKNKLEHGCKQEETSHHHKI